MRSPVVIVMTPPDVVVAIVRITCVVPVPIAVVVAKIEAKAESKKVA